MSFSRGFGVLVNQIVEAPRRLYRLGGVKVIRAKAVEITDSSDLGMLI